MKRKVNLVGKNTLTISLPSIYVRRYNIHKGDDLNIVDQNGNIVISAPENQIEPVMKSFVEATVDPQFNKLVLNNLYRLGADRITVQFNSEKIFDDIQRLCQDHFLGMEIIEKRKDRCIIENVTEPNPKKFDQMFKRIFIIILDSLETIKDSIETHNPEIGIFLVRQYNKIDQYANFCMRTLNKLGRSSGSQYTMVHYLLVMQGEMKRLFNLLNDVSVQKADPKFMKNVSELFRDFYNQFYKKELVKLHETNLKAKEFLYSKLMPESDNLKENMIMMHYCASLTRMLTLVISPAIAVIYQEEGNFLAL